MRTPIAIRSLVACGLVAGALAGCGSSDPSGDVRNTLHQFVNNVLDGNYAGACGLMTTSARAQLGGSQCSQRLGQAMQLASSSQKAAARKQAAKIDSFPVSVHGDTATISNPGGGSPTTLVKQNGHWLISGGSNSK